MPTCEFNFDGLIGPTHNYAGLAFGNVASAVHQHQPSQPRAAALQGLQKMKRVAEMGIGQCVLPPLRRPRIELLRELGFGGKNDSEIIESAYRASPHLVSACFSAASMWTANAATVSPGPDTHDDRLHITPANLSSTLHRSLEGPSTTRILQAIFADEQEFQVHPPLPCGSAFSDEGAANHTRLTSDHGAPGIEVFTYGIAPSRPQSPAPKKFPARQTLLASESIARRHQLDAERVLLWQQNPDAIDAGVFHNDVISVGNQNLLLAHELAFVDQARCLQNARTRFESDFQVPLHIVEFASSEISLSDAVRSYLFNSQLVTRNDGQMTLMCPIECQEIESAQRCAERLLEESNPVDEIVYLNLRQSMNNGGGPACLRLRVVLTECQQQAMHQGILLTETLAHQLEAWINNHYRETLHPDDLRDPHLIDESLAALEELATILRLPRDVVLDV